MKTQSSLNKNMLTQSFFLFPIVSCLLSFSMSAQAGNLYVYKNNNGDTLLTNVTNDTGFKEYNKQIKVTYYADTNVHSYKNWGGSESAVLPSYSKNKNLYDGIIAEAAHTHQLDSGLIKAVMHTESGFNPSARSPVGALGLMQLMPATARRFAVTNAYDPAQNVFGAAKYLKFLLKRFNYNTELALAAYNAGEGNVDKYKGIPPFRETRDYVKRVMSRYQNLYAGPISASSTTSAAGSNSNMSNNTDNSHANYNTVAQVAPVSTQSNRAMKIYAIDGVYTASSIENY